MLKSTGIIMILFGLLYSASANAQSFSVEAVRGPVTALGGIGPKGSLYAGGHWKGTYEAVFEGEKTSNGQFECVATGQPPGLFARHVTCTMTQEDGSFTSAWGCNPINADATEMTCVAGLYGRTGRFKGLTGGATTHIIDNKSYGVGQFYKRGE